MKRYIIGLFLSISVISFGQISSDQFIINCIANTGPEAKYLKDFRIKLGQGFSGNEFRFKSKIYLWKDTKYRFTMCTVENSKGQLVLKIKDEESKLILESFDLKTGAIYPFVDFTCSKSGIYQICFDFSDRLPGSGIGVVSILK